MVTDVIQHACINIYEEISCRKTEQKYQVTIGLSLQLDPTNTSEEQELQLKKTLPYKETRLKTNSNPPFVINWPKGAKNED